MNTITLHRVSDAGPVLKPCRPRVYVAGRRSYRFEALSVDWLAGPEFGEARIAAVRAEHGDRPPRIEQVDALPAVGQSVEIRAGFGQVDWVFRGVVAAHEVSTDGDSERLSARLIHSLRAALGGPIDFRMVCDGGETAARPRERVVFNAGIDTWASAEKVEVRGRLVRVFSAAADAVRWSVADALAYLLAVHAADIPVTADETTVSLAGEIDLGRLDVSGREVREAIATVADRAGLFLRVARDGRGGLVVQPFGLGRRGRLRLAPAGNPASAATSNLWQGEVEIARRPARRGVVVLGRLKRYEATFELSPGWDPYDVPDTWGRTVRSRSDDWPGDGDVLRRWVLNEDGAYSDGPWNLPLHEFGDVSETDFNRPTPRRLEPCLSTDEGGRSLGVVVEVSVDAGVTWRRWAGPVRVSADRCDVLLGGDELTGEYYQAALAGDARVRVTATVASDARLIAEIEGDAGAGCDVVSAGHSRRWAKVSEASIFAGVEGLGEPLEVDDTPRLKALALRRAAESSAVEATITLAWCEPTWAVGDLVDRVEGRGLSLAGGPGLSPRVTRVGHRFGDFQRTILTVR